MPILMSANNKVIVETVEPIFYSEFRRGWVTKGCVYEDQERLLSVISSAGDLALLAEAEAVTIKERLREIDIASIRSIREYIAAKPDAPKYLKDYDAAAAAEREKLKPKV